MGPEADDKKEAADNLEHCVERHEKICWSQAQSIKTREPALFFPAELKNTEVDEQKSEHEAQNKRRQSRIHQEFGERIKHVIYSELVESILAQRGQRPPQPRH